MARFPGFVYRHGEEPDPRFSLANERTFLAWIRTALALIAAGVALMALPLGIQTSFKVVAAIIFLVLGVVAAVQSWLGWARAELALRLNKALPAPAVGTVLAIGVVVAVVLVGIGSFA